MPSAKRHDGVSTWKALEFGFECVAKGDIGRFAEQQSDRVGDECLTPACFSCDACRLVDRSAEIVVPTLERLPDVQPDAPDCRTGAGHFSRQPRVERTGEQRAELIRNVALLPGQDANASVAAKAAG